MAARRPIAPRPTAGLQIPNVQDATTQRALDVISTSVSRLEGRQSRVVVSFDLAVGTNKIPHGLGRKVQGYTLTPTVANAGFAHAIDTSNPRPDLEVWVIVIGVAQPGAILEVY